MISKESFVQIFKTELNNDELSEHSEYKAMHNWSSLLSIIIINEVEQQSGIILTVADIKESTTLGELYDRLMAHDKTE